MNREALLETEAGIAIEYFKSLTDLNAVDEEGFTLLTGLIRGSRRGGSQELKIRALLEMGADPNFKDREGRHPLLEVEHEHAYAYYDALLTAGANPNIQFEAADYRNGGRTPLIQCILWAASTRRIAASTRRILEAGADPNLCDKKGKTALHYLLESDQCTPDLVQAMLAKGADASIADADGRTCLGIALRRENALVIALLLEAGVRPDVWGPEGPPPLSIVAGMKDAVPLLKIFHEAGSRLDDVDNYGETALHYAAGNMRAPAVEWLISAGAKVDVGDKEGITPLGKVVSCGDNAIAIFDLLLNAGASLAVTDHQGRTPIFYALRNSDYLKMLKHLLRAGARVNVQDHDGITPLMEAAGNDGRWNKILDIASVLLAAGADVHLRDKKGCTALHHACDRYQSGSVIPVLIKAGAEVDARDNEGVTPLMMACADCIQALLPLLQCSPNLDLTDKQGKTALMRGAGSCQSSAKLTRMLIDAGADIDIVDVTGKSATAHARPEALRLLIASGAKPNPFETGPLRSALEDTDFPLMIALFERGAKLRLKFPVFMNKKRTLEKLARGRSELLRQSVECEDGETAEELGKLLAKCPREAVEASDEELPAVLREGGNAPAPVKDGVTVVSAVSYQGRFPNYEARVVWHGDSSKKAMKAIRRGGSESAITASAKAIEKFRQKPFGVSVAKLSADGEGFIALWNEAAPKLTSNLHTRKSWLYSWRHRETRLDANDAMGLLAHFGVAILPGLLALARKKPAMAMPSLMKCDAPECALLMAENLRSKQTRFARQWLGSFPEAAILGLLPIAIGPSGESRDVAGRGIRYLQRNGHGDSIARVAALLGAEVSKAVDEVLSAEDPSEQFPEKLPALPSFWCADIHPAPILIESGKALPRHALDTVARLALASSYDAKVEVMENVSKVCTPDSLANFAWSLFDEWEEKGKKDTDGMFQILGYWGNDECARKLTSYIRRWPQSSNTPRSLLGLEILAAIGTDTALSQLQSIALKNKYQRTQKRAVELVEFIARQRNMTRQQFEDRTVPMLGLEEDGWMRLDFGRRQFLVGVDEKMRPIVKDGAGNLLKDLPKPGKNDEEAMAAQATAEWKEFCADLKAIAKLQLERLEQAMLRSRRWSGEEFRRWLLGHPLLAPAVRGLVWGIYRGRGKLLGTFAVAADGSLVGIDGRPVSVSSKALVGIPHPLDLDRTVADWKKWFARGRRGQPFAQLARSVYRRSEDTDQNYFGLNGAAVPSKALKVMKGNGWGEEIGDGGWIWGFYKKGCSVGAEPGVHINDYEWGGATEQTLEVSLSERLSDIDYSEMVRELQALRK